MVFSRQPKTTSSLDFHEPARGHQSAVMDVVYKKNLDKFCKAMNCLALQALRGVRELVQVTGE
ncbi:hypothetical protein BaRGS_00001548, partial [Batillaria attramentaria]